MYTKRSLVSTILAVGMLLAAANVTQAATEAEKQTAIDAGLAWLATQQQVDGRWMYGGGPDDYADVATTGAALLAFIEEGHTPGSGTAYSANVASGLNFLFLYAQTIDITVPPTPAGNPDTNGNGIGVKFSPVAVNNNRDIYQTGLAIIPIAAVGTPGAIVPGGPQAGRTYAAVIQDTVDYFAFAQNDEATGINRGGWRYFANEGTSDNSTSQWPVVGLIYAQSAGATVPVWVATELAFWVAAIQNPDGGSGYDFYGGAPGSNVSRTGTLLLQQVFSGAGAGTTAAQSYLNSQWLTTENNTWDGNFGHPYAMWAAYKGLEITIGVDDETTITNLNPDPGDIDNPDHNYNWYEDYCEYLVTTQVGGTWPGYSHWTGPLATAWYVNILAAIPIPINEPPVADAGDDQTVEQASYAGTQVTLDGSGSTDDGLMQPLTYAWTWTGGSAAGVSPIAIFPLGTTTVTLTVDDGEFTDSDTVVITVVDTTDPVITIISVNPEELWPPNHKMVPVIVLIEAEDICTETGLLEVSVTVTSSEPDDDKGDGAFTGDVDGQDGFTAPVDVLCEFDEEAGCFVSSFELRAERDGRGDGRVYTIEAVCEDASGNIATATETMEVTVAHDQGKGKK